MNFNGKHGCLKCSIIGKYSHISHTVVFTKTDQPARTNEKFRAKEYEGHQKSDTPLTKLPIDMIQDIIIADPLHLLELGVMKRLIVGWRSGDLGFHIKWSSQHQNNISEWLQQIQMPSEIHRDTRSFLFFAKWKGLEFRNFLNYLGVVVLRPFEFVHRKNTFSI